MRLNFIHLHAYGALSETTLELGDGLTVVYGLNEAGKSTLLSAFADLLCGIKRKTRMDFMVARTKLRIQASATTDDGSSMKVIRTSKNPPNDLVDTSTSKPVTAEVRLALTQHLDHNGLMTRFGLDHDRLVAGGRELMRGQGDLAEIVFEARTGTDVRSVVDRLEKKLAGLYQPHSSSTSLLVRANAHREDLNQTLKDKLATAEAVETASTSTTLAEAELERRRLATARLRAQHSWLNQLVESWPYWEQYRARREELEQADARGPRLSAEQWQSVAETSARLHRTQEEVRHEKSAAEHAELEYSQLDVNDKLLTQQPAIETLARNKPGVANSRTRASQLGGLLAIQRAKLTEILARLGLRDIHEPMMALASIAVADDRAADLNNLANRHDRISDDLLESQSAVAEATSELAAAQRGARPSGISDQTLTRDELLSVTSVRKHRDTVWNHIRRVWLDGIAVLPELGSNPTDLADRYSNSVNAADAAADDFANEAGSLATITERRRSLERAEYSQKHATQSLAEWEEAWRATMHVAGLPAGIGVAGWRERAELLAEAAGIAEKIATMEIELTDNAATVAEWDDAAAKLATLLGESIKPEYLVAWFDATKSSFDQSMSNQKAAAVHGSSRLRALERADRLLDEISVFEGSLQAVANEYGTDHDGLGDLAERTEAYIKAAATLAEPEGQLRARHPGVTFDKLIDELAGRDLQQLEVDLEAAQDAMAQAEEDVSAAQEEVIGTRQILDELRGRTGAEALQQELSQAAAHELDLIEDYATTRLMHHLLTQELRAYLESHRNPVLERASSFLSRLTKDRFTGLRIDGEGTNRALIVTGADDTDYETTALSEGTASQLYLALSLAGVLEVENERRHAGLETIPIFLDDVLMAFDDERAASALDLLAEIGLEQQIILFTHHAAVREQAASLSGAARVVSLNGPGLLG